MRTSASAMSGLLYSATSLSGSISTLPKEDAIVSRLSPILS